MSKQKIRKSIRNRFKVTKNGKVMRRQGFRRHIKNTKSAKQLRRLKRVKELDGFYAKKVVKALGAKKPKAKKVVRKSESKKTNNSKPVGKKAVKEKK